MSEFLAATGALLFRCTEHRAKNVLKVWGQKCSDLYKVASRSPSTRRSQDALSDLRATPSQNDRMNRFLDSVPTAQQFVSSGCLVHGQSTSNVSEIINSMLKGSEAKSCNVRGQSNPTDMVLALMNKCQQRFYEAREAAHKCNQMLTPYAMQKLADLVARAEEYGPSEIEWYGDANAR